jgi:hypothetical protein
MKDYVARSYGHTPRKLPLGGVPSRATSRFIAYQALQLYTISFFLSIDYKNFLKNFTIKNYRIQAHIFCAHSTKQGAFRHKFGKNPPPDSISQAKDF